MEEKLLSPNKIVNDFFKKDIIKRSPNTPLLQTPHINFKLSCKNLDCINDYFYFKDIRSHTKRKSSLNRFFIDNNSQTQKVNLNHKSFINSPGVFYKAFLMNDKNIDTLIQLSITLSMGAKDIEQPQNSKSNENGFNFKIIIILE